MVDKTSIVIRGKIVTFARRVLKSGAESFYRSGKLAQNAYQRRIARGVLEGKSLAEAAGRAGAKFTHAWGDRFYGRAAIDENLARFTLEGRPIKGTTSSGTVPWAEPPNRAQGAFERRRYYALVNIQVQSAIEAGSDIAHDDGAACTPATIALLIEREGKLVGMTRAEFRREFERVLERTLERMRLRSCTGDLRRDVLAIWRHSQARQRDENVR